MRKSMNAKPLFVLNDTKQYSKNTETTQPQTEQPKKKRGRPKKIVDVSIVETKKPAVKKEIIRQDNTIWKDFNVTLPEPYKPCKFKVETDNGDVEFTGYITMDKCLCFDDPYKGIVLRKRFNNLYYCEVSCCHDVNDCPSGFPYCNMCKNKK